MKDLWTWAERRENQHKGLKYRNHSSKTASFVDGQNVRAKTCECQGRTSFDSSEGRCIKCGRERKDAPFVA